MILCVCLGSALCLEPLSVQVLKLLWFVAGECTDQSSKFKVMRRFGTVLVLEKLGRDLKGRYGGFSDLR